MGARHAHRCRAWDAVPALRENCTITADLHAFHGGRTNSGGAGRSVEGSKLQAFWHEPLTQIVLGRDTGLSQF